MRVRRAQARLCGRQESPAPVIPAKAGIQRIAAKPAARNQVRIADNKSLLPIIGLQWQVSIFVVSAYAEI